MSIRRAQICAVLGLVAASCTLVVCSEAGAAAAGVRAAPLQRETGGLAGAVTSANWAGYAVTGLPAPSVPQGATTATPAVFDTVAGTWVQPAATCATGNETYSAFWVGLGGFSPDAGGLEQIGTAADCSATGKAVYSAWWELIPAPPVRLRLKIRPGDTLSASVTMIGQIASFRLRDLTRRTLFTKKVRVDVIDVTSAEWIAEAPSTCNVFGNCRPLPLTNFGSVTFSKATAISVGHPGTISDPAWSAIPIELRGATNAFASPRFVTDPPLADAIPTDLSSDGSSFSVAWQPASAAPPPTPPQ